MYKFILNTQNTCITCKLNQPMYMSTVTHTVLLEREGIKFGHV